MKETGKIHITIPTRNREEIILTLAKAVENLTAALNHAPQVQIMNNMIKSTGSEPAIVIETSHQVTETHTYDLEHDDSDDDE
jgi:hypothetical protein